MACTHPHVQEELDYYKGHREGRNKVLGTREEGTNSSDGLVGADLGEAHQRS